MSNLMVILGTKILWDLIKWTLRPCLKVCIVNDPRPENQYEKLYTVEYLGNMSGGRRVLYINQPIDVLKKLTVKSVQEGEICTSGWGMYIRVRCVHQGEVCTSGWGVYIRVRYVHQGEVCTSGWGMYIRVRCVHQGEVCTSGWGVYIRVRYVHQGEVCTSGWGMYIRVRCVHQGEVCTSGWGVYIRVRYVHQGEVCTSGWGMYIRVRYVHQGEVSEWDMHLLLGKEKLMNKFSVAYWGWAYTTKDQYISRYVYIEVEDKNCNGLSGTCHWRCRSPIVITLAVCLSVCPHFVVMQ